MVIASNYVLSDHHHRDEMLDDITIGTYVINNMQKKKNKESIKAFSTIATENMMIFSIMCYTRNIYHEHLSRPLQ